jgi:hypothetical protein
MGSLAIKKEGARGGTVGSPAKKVDEEICEFCADVLHDFSSRLKGREPGRPSRFRRLVTRSPSCRSKLSGAVSG